jgi:Arc/MetJ-type ribon-helix-helix transcriptional regulator
MNEIVKFFITQGIYSSEEEVITAALIALVEKKMKEEAEARELEYTDETYAMPLSQSSTEKDEVKCFIEDFSRELQRAENYAKYAEAISNESKEGDCEDDWWE